MNMIEQLIRIDHRNRVSNFDAKTILFLKERLYSYLEDIGEVNNADIIKYFEKVICNISDTDSFIASNLITKKLVSMNKSSLVKETELPDILDYISTKAVKGNSLQLNDTNVKEIAKVLIKFFNDARVKYHIFTQQDFIKKLNTNEADYEDIQTRSSTFVDMLNESIMQLSQNCDAVKMKRKFPSYILDMKEEFQFIKSIDIVVPMSNEVELTHFILVYLNIHWLFPNILEVFINLDSNRLIGKRMNFQSNMENKQMYETVMLIPFFINHLHNVHSLKFRLADSYQAELDFLLRNEKILTNGFHILDLLNSMSSLSTLDLSFNSLDSNTFKRVLALIHTNNNLRSLSLNFFPSDEYYSSENLIRFATLYEFNLNKRNSFTIVDENEYIMDNLVTYFESNLEFLLIILMSKVHNLNSLRIQCEIPTILLQNDKYISCIYKFTLNLFKLLEQSNNQMQNFEFHSANFTLNGKTHSSLNKFLEGVQINRNKTITNYVLNTRFYKISNLMSLLPRNVEFLSISELDNMTLKALTTCFRQSAFSSLRIIHITLSTIYFDVKKVDDLFDFFQVPKNKDLKEIYLTCKNKIQQDVMDQLLGLMKADKIQKYEISLSRFNKQYVGGKDFYYEFNSKVYSVALLMAKKGCGGQQKVLSRVNHFLKRRKQKIITIKIIE
jgi:hypothetical protein